MLPFWKIVGFCVYSALFVYGGGYEASVDQSIRTVLYTVLPVVQCLFIVLSSHSEATGFPEYRRHISQGLALSMVGDACLVYQHYEARLIGAAFFAAAHICYLKALGFKPRGGMSTLVSFAVTGISIFLFLLPGLHGLDSAVAMGYLLLLLTMAWRAMVRYQVEPSLVNLLGCVGAMLFVVSDYVLLRDWFIADWQYTRAVCMSTYHLAQLGIALTATDDYTPTGY